MIFCTLPVAATSFFAGEVEIYCFVTERAKRCIAAKSLTPKTLDLTVSHQIIIANNSGGKGDNCIGVLGSKFYWHSVVGKNTYSMYTKMGVGM